MRTVFLANVGNRDIVFNVGKADSPFYLSFDKNEEGEGVRRSLGCAEGTRAIAGYLRSHLDAYVDRLKLPILTTALHMVLRQVKALDQVLLFGTDQPEEVGEHRLWDTIESAHLIRELLSYQFEGQLGDIGIVPVTINPSVHDLAYIFVGEALTKNLPPTGLWKVFASIKGGIPALNAALLHHVLDLYGAQAILIEVSEPKREDRLVGREGEARIVSSWSFRKSALLRVVRELLDRYDYSGVEQFLVAEGVHHPEIVALLQHAQARLNLDFDGAARALEDLGSGKPHQWKISAQEAWGRQRLAELAWTAQILLDRKDFVGFVTRVASLCETCRRQVVKLVSGIQIDKGHLTQAEARRCSQELPKFLEAKRSSKIDGGWRADRDLFNALIQWGSQQESNIVIVEAVREVQELIGRLGALERIRHEALHLVRGVSAVDIEKALPSCQKRFPELTHQLLDTMARLERMTSVATHFVGEIYGDLNQAILQRLQQVSM